MSTYYCKCGKIFTKNTGAATTGNRMPDYGLEHECYGCQFVKELKTWDPTQGINIVDNHECRGSKELHYSTWAHDCDSKGSTLHVSTLDLKFVEQLKLFQLLQSGTSGNINPGQDDSTGLIPFSFYFENNLKGESTKQALLKAFFVPAEGLDSQYYRKDIPLEQEKETVLNQIKEAKAMAQGITDNSEFTAAVETMEASIKKSVPSTVYKYQEKIYRVDEIENGKFRTFFNFEMFPAKEDSTFNSIPACDTFDIAQKMLDDYAQKHGYEVFTLPTSEAEKPLESDLSSDNTADVAGELNENESSGQQEQDETPNLENGEPDCDDDFNDSENDSAGSDDNSCDWKNASGADEDEDPVPSIPKDVVVGERVSLRNNEFDDILDAADASLNSLIRTLREKKQHDGELNIKVIFEDYGSAFRFSGQVGGKINYSLKSVKISLDDNIEIKFDESGNPVIPYDRQHQLNFDEIQPGRVIPPTSVTTTVDGNTGLVVKVHADGESEDESKPHLSPCDHNDCPFFGVDDEENAGCCFETEDKDDSSFPGDVWSAVHMESCTRPEVLESYRKNNPDEDVIPGDTDYEGGDEMTNDVPSEQVIEEVGEPSERCAEPGCMFYDPDAPGCCAFNTNESFYGAPDNYPADEDEVIEAVEKYGCQKPELLSEYNKIKENETDEN